MSDSHIDTRKPIMLENACFKRNFRKFPRVILMVGLPCSGKSTAAKRLVDEAALRVIVCPDTIRLALHRQQFIAEAEPMVWAIAQVMVKTLLREGYSVIIDATNTTKERRRMWTSLKREYGEVQIHWVKTGAAECKKRNKELHRLDPEIIDRMEHQFEPPTAIEGEIVEIDGGAS